MRDLFNKLKIPTLLGLGVIILGIAAGVFLTLKEQTFTSQASPNVSAQNLTLSNISDTGVTISWQTSIPTPAFITFGQLSPNENTILDDRDANPPAGKPTPYSTHYVTIKNLAPKTTYQYKIISGKISSAVSQFSTATPPNLQTGFRPIIGSVVDGGNPLEEGVAYLSIDGAAIQSGVIKTSGNFLIPLAQIRKADLSESFPLTEDALAKLTIESPKGQSTVTFKLSVAENELPPINLGEDLDLTSITPTPTPAPKLDLDKYDLNGDGKINAADNSVILGNQGNNPKNKKADLNGDGEVNQEDLDLMSKQINQ